MGKIQKNICAGFEANSIANVALQQGVLREHSAKV